MPVSYTNKPTRNVGDTGVTDDFNDLDTAMGQARDSIANLEASPPAHTHPVTAADITDSTSTGRAVLTAADQVAARTAIGAGTSSLALGNTASTAAAGNHTHDTRYPLIVEHGGTASTARPAATSVLWIGTVTPTNMTDADLYLGPA